MVKRSGQLWMRFLSQLSLLKTASRRGQWTEDMKGYEFAQHTANNSKINVFISSSIGCIIWHYHKFPLDEWLSDLLSIITAVLLGFLIPEFQIHLPNFFLGSHWLLFKNPGGDFQKSSGYFWKSPPGFFGNPKNTGGYF